VLCCAVRHEVAVLITDKAALQLSIRGAQQPHLMSR
jgi:hypothetical protein